MKRTHLYVVAALVALGLVLAAVLALFDKPVPDLVPLVVLGGLSVLGIDSGTKLRARRHHRRVVRGA